MRASWDVLRQDKEILVFPVLSGIALLLIMASFAVPVFALGGIDTVQRIARHNGAVGNLVVLFAFYFINYFVIIFFNTAIVACATIRMRGGNPTVGDGLQASGSRLFEIAGWALVSASVGMVLRMIEERSTFVGRIFAGLLGMAWGITSYLVIPILVNERKGPMEAFQESARLLKKTWGEELIGGFSFGLVFFVLSLPAIRCAGRPPGDLPGGPLPVREKGRDAQGIRPGDPDRGDHPPGLRLTFDLTDGHGPCNFPFITQNPAGGIS
jgi:uncharacterized membrane protein